MEPIASLSRRGFGRCFKGYTAVLRALKMRSMRRGIWNSVLTGLERAQVSLTLKVVRNVRSSLLARVLDSIVEKLRSALESRVSSMVFSVGFPMAQRLSRIAQGWGNQSAEKWVRDLGFARFLAVMSLNSSSTESSI